MSENSERQTANRSRIVEAASQLLHEEGPDAVTTRRVAELAGVQPPAIYRLFGDKDGLLEAVIEHTMAMFAAAKAAVVMSAADAGIDPLDDLRAGWRSALEFGLANPALFRLLSDPERVARSPAARLGREVLVRRVHRVAATGRLRVEEERAGAMIQAAGVGVVQTLLASPLEARDPELGRAMFDAVLAQILTDAPHPAAALELATAIAFRAIAPDLAMLSRSERTLLDDWLARVVSGLDRSD